MERLNDTQLVKIIDEYIKSSNHEEYYKIVKKFIPVEIIDKLVEENKVIEANTFGLLKKTATVTTITFNLAPVNKKIYLLAIDELRKRC